MLTRTAAGHAQPSRAAVAPKRGTRAARDRRNKEACRVVVCLLLFLVGTVALLVLWLQYGTAQRRPMDGHTAHAVAPRSAARTMCGAAAPSLWVSPRTPSELASLAKDKKKTAAAADQSAAPADDVILSCVWRQSVSMMNRLLHDFRQDALQLSRSADTTSGSGNLAFLKLRDAIFTVFSRRDKGPDGYHGQGHEGGLDRFIAEVLLPRKCNGRFFEMGANDGTEGSNSCEQRLAFVLPS